jgi:hypothetical protein
LLAWVNNPFETSSDSRRASEDSGDLQKGDHYVGHFGDIMHVKKENTLRLGFQNIGGFPTQRGKLKEDNIRLGISKWDFDIFGMAEVNIDWSLMPEQDWFPSRTKEWWTQQHVSWANNRTLEPRQQLQYGGTAIFSVDKASYRATEKGADETNLGRWVWTRYKGKGTQSLRIITAYRPNPTQGPFTVYAQQNTFFRTIQRDICPRQAFLIDLKVAINQFLEVGDHIILMIDGNSNMKSSDLSNTLSQLSLKEAILDKHGLQGPATHKRNATSSPIDDIWISPGLEISQGGYFAYDQVIPSDHRCIWINISFMVAWIGNLSRRLLCI